MNALQLKQEVLSLEKLVRTPRTRVADREKLVKLVTGHPDLMAEVVEESLHFHLNGYTRDELPRLQQALEVVLQETQDEHVRELLALTQPSRAQAVILRMARWEEKHLMGETPYERLREVAPSALETLEAQPGHLALLLAVKEDLMEVEKHSLPTLTYEGLSNLVSLGLDSEEFIPGFTKRELRMVSSKLLSMGEKKQAIRELRRNSSKEVQELCERALGITEEPLSHEEESEAWQQVDLLLAKAEVEMP